MSHPDLRRIARRKCADALEQALSSGDTWTYTDACDIALSEEDERLMSLEIKRVVMGLRNLKAPPR